MKPVGDSELNKMEKELQKLYEAFGLTKAEDKRKVRERKRRELVDEQGPESQEEEEEVGSERGGTEEEDDIVFMARNRMDVLVVLTPGAFRLVKKRKPDMAILRTIECRGIIITCHAERRKMKREGMDLNAAYEGKDNYDFYSRFFGPRCGIDEDPVTGSAHCCLAPYWHARLGKTKLEGYQDSQRGGVVRMVYVPAASRVYLSGQAVVVKSGWLGM